MRSTPLSFILLAAETLFPGYFALVMATGTLCIALYLLDYQLIAEALFIVNVLAYAILCGLALLRVVCFPRLILADLIDQARAPGFFALVADT